MNSTENIPFGISKHQAIEHLKATGDWPAPRMPADEAASDYFVNAAFNESDDRLQAYLAGELQSRLMAQAR